MRPTVVRITEVSPLARRLHVKGEMHPGELSERGYVQMGDEWVLEIGRPDRANKSLDKLTEEFRTLRMLGYEFAETDEWSPAEIYRRIFPDE